jgi:hypothetical protein
VLRDIITESTQRGAAIPRMSTRKVERRRAGETPSVAVTLEMRGKPAIEELTVALDNIDGMLGVETRSRIRPRSRGVWVQFQSDLGDLVV